MQLPTVEGLGLGESLEGEAAVLVHSAAQCCVDSCVRNQVRELENSIQIPTTFLILFIHQGGGPGMEGSCPHTIACLAPGVGEATPVMLR